MSKIKYEDIKEAAKDTVNLNRNDILYNIKRASEWANAEEKLQYSSIKENIQWLKNNLNLNTLDTEILYLERENNKDNKLSGCLTNRQMNCMLTFSSEIQRNNLQGAYHELYDFIESYKNLNDKPIDMVERIFIRNAVIQIENIMNENK